jgi:hypothetical protein
MIYEIKFKLLYLWKIFNRGYTMCRHTCPVKWEPISLGWHLIFQEALSYWHMHNEVVCLKGEKSHTEIRESPYGLITWSYTKKKISEIALD